MHENGCASDNDYDDDDYMLGGKIKRNILANVMKRLRGVEENNIKIV